MTTWFPQKSARQQIVDALISRLSSIQKKNGFNTDVGVSVVAWQPSQSPTPIEDLNPAEIEYRDEEIQSSTQNAPVGCFLHKLKIHLEVRVSSSTTIDDLRHMEADIHKAISYESVEPNPGNWGGNSTLTEPSSSKIRIEQIGAEAAGLTMEFFIHYRTREWDPYQTV
jgi:hypothetical protein